MSSRFFTLSFHDLSFEKRQDLITETQKELREQYKREGKEALKDKYHDPKPKTWQEAFCMIYAIDWEVREDAKFRKTFDWSFAVEQHAEDQAEKLCHKAINNMRIEVEV